MTIAVYGDFKKEDIRIKIFNKGSLEVFRFQNTLIEAGYDCKLFNFATIIADD